MGKALLRAVSPGLHRDKVLRTGFRSEDMVDELVAVLIKVDSGVDNGVALACEFVLWGRRLVESRAALAIAFAISVEASLYHEGEGEIVDISCAFVCA